MSRNFNNTYRFNNNCPGNRNNAYTNVSGNNYMYNNSCPYVSDSNDDFPLGMAYVPIQKFRDLYEPCECLKAGTIFKELYKPFLG